MQPYYSKSNLKIAVVAAAGVLVVAIGIGGMWHSHSKTHAQSILPIVPVSAQMNGGVTGTAPAANPAAGLNLDANAAIYLASARAQVVSQTKTSAQFQFTFSDGATAEETISLQPDQQYSPTTEDLAKAATSRSQVYNVKFTAAPDGADKLHLNLQYFVPYTSLSPDVQHAIQTQTTSDFFQLVPSAQAQVNMAGVGISIGFGIAKQVGGALMGIWSAAGKSAQHQQWMNQLAALENCAQNPTNQLTQTAYANNPAYQQQTLTNIQNARTSVQQVTATRYLAQLNATAAGLVSGPFGLVLGGLSMLNDMTLVDVANQEVIDAGSNVTNCAPQPGTPPVAGGQDGTILYRMHRTGYQAYNQEDHFNQGSFTISTTPVGSIELHGSGGFQGTIVSTKFHTNVTCKGASGISGTGGMGQLEIGSNATTGACKGTEGGVPINRNTYMVLTDNNFMCHFDQVDLVNGGRYTVQADGEESAWTTCELELKPQQH